MSKLTILTGKVEAVLISNVAGVTKSYPKDYINCSIESGIMNDSHSGIRRSDAREDELKEFGFPKGTVIANNRQFSAISLEELRETGKDMGISGQIPYGCLGENIVVSGIRNFTSLPPNTKLFFETPQHEIRCVLSIVSENGPCLAPGKNIAKHFEDESLAVKFPKAAMGRRGVVGIVYTFGQIKVNDMVYACYK